MIVAKMVLSEVRECWEKGKRTATLVFTTRYETDNREDQLFARAVPVGRYEMTVNSQAAIEFFRLGTVYYFDALPKMSGRG